MICPRCRIPLEKVKVPGSKMAVYSCATCGGKAVSWPVVRGAIVPSLAIHMWQEARQQKERHGAACPMCSRAMALVVPRQLAEQVPVDICPSCYLAWFDRHEFESLPQKPPPAEPAQDLSPQAREAVALATIRQIERKEEQTDDGPPELWHWLLGLFGLPVEIEGPKLRTLPWLTWSLVACCVLVYFYSLQDLPGFVEQLGFIPDDPMRRGGITILASFFLHGGFWHLLSNMYFLLVFGDNVEDHVGRWFYAVLIILSHVMGDVFHSWGDPRSSIPCIGASAGISGVIVFYGLQFPQAKLGFLLRWWLFFKWIRFPAVYGLLAWVVLQTLTAFLQVSGAGTVSALAHLGGATVGLIAWAIWRNQLTIGQWLGLLPGRSGPRGASQPPQGILQR